MDSLHYTTYPGLGEWAKENLHYSQAVRIGNVIKISGQGQARIHSDLPTLRPTDIGYRRVEPVP
jgi:enamine deaminase RidA (YjgF/YER057c/UK114 family)